MAADTLHYAGTRTFEAPSDWYQEMEKDVCPEEGCHNLKHPESRVCQSCHMKRMRAARMANVSRREVELKARFTMERFLLYLEDKRDGNAHEG